MEKNQLETKLEVLCDTISQAKHIENLIKQLNSKVFEEFQVKLDTDILDINKSLTSLNSFYNLLKSTRFSVHSTYSGFFSLLPVELVLYIFSFLTPFALCTTCKVNWEFKRFSEEQSLWKEISNANSANDVFWKQNDDEEQNWKEVYRWYHECEKKVSFESIGLRLPSQSSPQSARNEDKEDSDDGSDEGFEIHRGKETYLDGSIYRGEWIRDKKGNGKRNGKGIQTWIEGDVYKGEWKRDKRTGYGIHIWPDGHYYAGNYDDDKRNGNGVFKWPDGREYRGNYLDDQRNGDGEFIWPNGDRYVGMYKNSNRNGTGSFTWADGRKYEGEWKDGGYHGTGQYTHRDGCTYSGSWKENMRHGKGIFRWTDDDYFEGEWNEGRRRGKGFLNRKQKSEDSKGSSYIEIEQNWSEEKFDKHNKGISEEKDLSNAKKRKLEGKEEERSSTSPTVTTVTTKKVKSKK